MTSEAKYQYQARAGICRIKNGSQVASIGGYYHVKRNNLTDLYETLIEKGPVAIAVASAGWEMYGGGIWDGCNYKKTINLNHAVTVVGYGEEYGRKF